MTSSRERFVERMAGALQHAGVPRAPALVFAALLVDEDGRMTAAELGDLLGISTGSVSGAVRYLDQLGMVRRERERGSRRDIYVVDDDAWHGTMVRTEQLYAPMIAALEAGAEELGARDPAHLRLALTREFLEFVNDEMASLAGRWEHRRRAAQARARA
jgi:DNA-binding transcriptional regulator GbsR (MarR family)